MMKVMVASIIIRMCALAQATAIDVTSGEAWKHVFFQWDAAGGASHLWAAIAAALTQPDVSADCDVILLTDGRDTWNAAEGDGGALQLLQRGFRGRVDVLCTRIDAPPPLSKLAGLFGGLYHAVDVPYGGAQGQGRAWDTSNATLDSIDDFLIAQLLHEQVNEPSTRHSRLPDGRLGRATQFFMRELRDDPSGLRRWETQLATVQQRSAENPPRLQLAALERAVSALRNIDAAPATPAMQPVLQPAAIAAPIASAVVQPAPPSSQTAKAKDAMAEFKAPWIIDMQASPSAQHLKAADQPILSAKPFLPVHPTAPKDEPTDRAIARDARTNAAVGPFAPEVEHVHPNHADAAPEDTATLLTEVLQPDLRPLPKIPCGRSQNGLHCGTALTGGRCGLVCEQRFPWAAQIIADSALTKEEPQKLALLLTGQQVSLYGPEVPLQTR